MCTYVYVCVNVNVNVNVHVNVYVCMRGVVRMWLAGARWGVGVGWEASAGKAFSPRSPTLKVWGLGFRVWGLGIRV